MSYSSCSEASHHSWTAELEAALLGSNECCDVRAIARCRVLPDALRAAAWLSCLDVRPVSSDVSRSLVFTSVYDLAEQTVLRRDIVHMVDQLGNSQHDRVSVESDVESVVTHYCKTQRLAYCRHGGWLDLLQPLVALRFDKYQLYTALGAILHKFVPRNLDGNGDAFHLLRLLLLYHDPELCNFLDSRKINPDDYCRSWFASLFSACCSLKTINKLWDIYFQMDDPFMVFFLSLVILINAKERLVEMRESSRDQMCSTLCALPSFLQQDDLHDFCELACFYSNKTPRSFRRRLHSSMFGVCAPQLSSLLQRTVPLSQSLCLPVYPDEVTGGGGGAAAPLPHATHGAGSADHFRHELSSSSSSCGSLLSLERSLDRETGVEGTASRACRVRTTSAQQQVEFFLVDCRPADHYNCGHWPSAFHLDCSLMLTEPDAFSTAVSALMAHREHNCGAADSTARLDAPSNCSHICFIGTGDDIEDRLLNMVVASFLQKGTACVSKLEGGYMALHELLSNNLSALTDHCSALCRVCSANCSPGSAPRQPSSLAPHSGAAAGQRTVSILDRFGGVWKKRGQQVRDKIVDIITNVPVERQQQQQQQQLRHVSAQDKGRRYRNVAPIFSLEDDEDPVCEAEAAEDSCVDLAEISDWLSQPDVLSHFVCHQLKDDHSLVPSVLLVTGTQLVVLRQLADRQGWAQLASRRSLSSLVQITSKRRRPELITFKYGVATEDTVSVTGLDRFHITKAGEATKAVKLAILQLSQPELLSAAPPTRASDTTAPEPNSTTAPEFNSTTEPAPNSITAPEPEGATGMECHDTTPAESDDAPACAPTSQLASSS